MADHFDWLLDVPYWEQDPAGHRSCMFSLLDFLQRSHLSPRACWQTVFDTWRVVQMARHSECFDARLADPLYGVEMVRVERRTLAH